MDCPRIREMLSAYLDGQLAAADRELVGAHLAACRRCSAELEELRRTVARLRGLDDVEAPAWLTQRVMARVRGEQKRWSLFQRLFSPMYVKVPLRAAAMVLIAVVTLYIFRTMQHEPMPERAAEPRTEKAAPEQPRGVPPGPPARQAEPAPAPQPQREQPPASAAPATGSPEMSAPSSPQPPAVGRASREERAPAPAAAPQEHEPLREKKAFKAETGRADGTAGESAPAAAAAPRKKDGRVIWSDETITPDDVAKVIRVTLVQETGNTLIFDVGYYLSPAYDGDAAVGIYPDIPDRAVGEARALKGTHTVSIRVSRAPGAGPATSHHLRIEVAGYRLRSLEGPLYRRILPYEKHWEGQ